MRTKALFGDLRGISTYSPGCRNEQLLPFSIVAQNRRAERALIRASDFDDLLDLDHLDVLTVGHGALAVERQSGLAFIERAFIDPKVTHRRAYPASDKLSLFRVEAECKL